MRIALAQINTTVGDLSGNAEKILDYVGKARFAGADIVTFPELSVCGYPPEDLLLKEGFIKDSSRALGHIISKIPEDILVVLGCITTNSKGRPQNSAALIKGRKKLALYHKIELPNYGVFDEKRYFYQGEKIPVFSLDGCVFGVNICEDIWLDRVTEAQVKAGAEFVLNISASPFHAGKTGQRVDYMSAKARRLGVHIFYNNTIGGQDELVFDGNSFIVGPDRKINVSAKSFEEDLIFYDYKCKDRGKNASSIRLGSIKAGVKPPINNSGNFEKITELEEIYRALITGTRDYIKKNGFKKVVVGVSGGIDSAITCALACDAIGRENVVGVTMPSVYSSKEIYNDAVKLGKSLKIRLMEIPIKQIFDVYMDELKGEFSGLKPDIAEENLQARIRGNILMAFSNKFGWLVLSTGNKSEVSCGYSTLYGDMAGGFNILKDVYKTLVYDLSAYVNRVGKYPIPLSILKRPPTAELRPNQKDSDSLPPYSVLDAILKLYIESDKGYKEIIKQRRFDAATVKKVVRLVDRSEFKRRQAAPGVKITPKAFGRDRRMPITNRYSQ
jgi:NAD+ synthase (glutamine-hydrolysing)